MARYISRSFDRSRLRPWPGIHNRVTVYVTRHREPSPSATSDTAPREKTRNFDRNGRSAAGYGRPYISRRCISRAFQLSENPYKFRLVSSSPRQRAFSTDEPLSFFFFLPSPPALLASRVLHTLFLLHPPDSLRSPIFYLPPVPRPFGCRSRIRIAHR